MSNNTSSKTEADLAAIDPAVRRASRMKLLLIIAIFAVPLILATVYLQMVKSSGGTVGDTSRGQLIQPAVPLTEFALSEQDGDFTLDEMRGHWTLLYMPQGECLEKCELQLYYMRQVRLALNQRMDRVKRVVLTESPEQLKTELLAEHVGLVVAAGTPEEQAGLRDQVRAAEAAMEELSDAIYMIDPMGNVMLRFPPDLPPKSMLKDIVHLLKVSRIG
ncbi:SCO family protein [Granulosicoccus antarcticus]|uniref:Thioredoxin domain-containing protein n=1 Tax=Granulosicoccus antarcticus IMCC3135 TaxID=1192854 RepID=A0A2Z2NKW0_9GAMM|nr:SCO family protein [Granulosicoccus antarcticus]ASJ71155.1 hypothetical protein IMCC3135_05210 [Granulosicoccus antarcticus IMCC3135]